MNKHTTTDKQITLCSLIGHTYRNRVFKSRYGAYLTLRECIVCGKVTKNIGKDTSYAKD